MTSFSRDPSDLESPVIVIEGCFRFSEGYAQVSIFFKIYSSDFLTDSEIFTEGEVAFTVVQLFSLTGISLSSNFLMSICFCCSESLVLSLVALILPRVNVRWECLFLLTGAIICEAFFE